MQLNNGKWIQGTGEYSVGSISPPIESGQILLNNQFLNWTAGVLDNYNHFGVDANNYSEEALNGVRFVATGGTHYMFQSSVGVSGRFYKIVIDIPVVTSGEIRMYLTSGTNILISTPGVYEFYSTTTSTVWYIQGAAGGCDIIVKSITIEEIPEGYPLIDKGDKFLECTSAGTVSIPSTQAYGEWEWDWYSLGAGMFIQFISNMIGHYNDVGINGYMFYLGGSEEINLSRMNGSSSLTVLGQSAFPLIDINTWYKCKLTRTLDGEFHFYMKGGDFGTNDWTLVVAATGSNPVTDTTYKESKYFSIHFSIGDRISNIIMRKAVQQ